MNVTTLGTGVQHQTIKRSLLLTKLNAHCGVIGYYASIRDVFFVFVIFIF